MKYLVRVSKVWVFGYIWMPGIEAAMEYTLTDNDVIGLLAENGELTREALAGWLHTNAGDFSSIIDFQASVEVGDRTVEFEWAEGDNEFKFHQAMFGDES